MFYVQAGLQGAVFDWQYWQNKNDLVADYTSGNIYFYYKTIFFYYQNLTEIDSGSRKDEKK